MPIGFAQSGAGEYAGGIFWIVAYALIASWVVAVYFTPYLGVRLLPQIKVCAKLSGASPEPILTLKSSSRGVMRPAGPMRSEACQTSCASCRTTRSRG